MIRTITISKCTLATVVALTGVVVGADAAEREPDGFFSGSHASVSSRTMYLNSDNRDGGRDQEEAAQGLTFNLRSGYTSGTLGFGLDTQIMTGIHLDGGRGKHPDSNSFAPSDSDGSAEKTWTRGGANAKFKVAKTELKVGSALQPNLPILVASDVRLLYQTFQGAILTSNDIDQFTFTGGKITQEAGRASSNYSGLSVSGGTEDSNSFQFGGVDWRASKHLTLQAYHSQLENYYKQTFLGLLHVYPINDDQSFKTDLRFFDSRSDGKNGEAGYYFDNNNGYAKKAGEVDNKTWSAAFTYSIVGHSLMVGQQRVSGDGGFVWVNNGSITDSRGRNEGQGGYDFYLFTDSMINQFARAGEHTTFGQYTYDFARMGVPGLKASLAYLRGDNIKDVAGGSDHSEWERDMRIDYVVQEGVLKNFGTTLRHGSYRGDGSSGVRDTDQTRLIFNYTYNFF